MKFVFFIGVWDNQRTKMLLFQYSELHVQVGPLKKFKNLKVMFENIAVAINAEFNTTFTGEQCSNRFKTLQRRKTGRCFNSMNKIHILLVVIFTSSFCFG